MRARQGLTSPKLNHIRQWYSVALGPYPMEIKSTGRIETTSVRRASKGASASEGGFKIADSGESARASIAAPGPLAAVETILTLQNIEDTTDGRSKGAARGEQILDLLDHVRDGLLAGGIPRTTLNRLASAVSRRQENFSDPRLQNVLDEIELRARVELAKLEQVDRLAV